MPCFKFPSEQLKSNHGSTPRLTKIHSRGVTAVAGGHKSKAMTAAPSARRQEEGSGLRVGVKRTVNESQSAANVVV